MVVILYVQKDQPDYKETLNLYAHETTCDNEEYSSPSKR